MRMSGAAVRGWWRPGTVMILGLGAGMLLMLGSIYTGDAQEKPPVEPVPAAGAKPTESVPLQGAIQREIAAIQREHAERINALEALKNSLIAVKADEQRIRDVQRLVDDENRDFDVRIRILRGWLDALARQPATSSQSALDAESRDAARAIGNLNQSFVIPPVLGRHAATGGSMFVDRADADAGPLVPDPSIQRSDASPAANRGAQAQAPHAAPTQIVRAGRYAGGCQPGAWIWGEVPWRYHEVAPADVTQDLRAAVLELRNQVEQLRAEIGALQSRAVPAPPSK